MKIKKKNQSIKSIGYSIKNKLPKEAIEAYNELLKKDNTINYQKIDKDFGSSEYEFSISSSAGELFKKLFKKIISKSNAEIEQEIFYLKLKKLLEYNAVTENTIKKKILF